MGCIFRPETGSPFGDGAPFLRKIVAWIHCVSENRMFCFAHQMCPLRMGMRMGMHMC